MESNLVIVLKNILFSTDKISYPVNLQITNLMNISLNRISTNSAYSDFECEFHIVDDPFDDRCHGNLCLHLKLQTNMLQWIRKITPTWLLFVQTLILEIFLLN